MSLASNSFGRRLMTMLLSVCAAVVLVTSLIFAVYELLTFRRATLAQLEMLARLIGAHSAAPLRDRDVARAAAALDSARRDAGLTHAALYDTAGNLVAASPAEAAVVRAIPAVPGAPGVAFHDSQLEAFHLVEQDGRPLGTLYLRSGLDGMYRRFTLYAAVVVLVLAASLLTAWVVSRMLRRQLTHPLLKLVEAARAVSERRDYSVRVQHDGADELGALTEAFNHMLTQIHDQDDALREGAARMRAVLDSALSAVVVIDAEDRVMDWTERAAAMFGWSQNEAKGQRLADLVVPLGERDRYRRLRNRLFASNGRRWLNRILQTRALRRDGAEFPVEVSISRLKTGGEVTLCGFVTDITQRQRAEAEIRQLNQDLEQRVAERTEQLESANRELEAFSYSVSHDLRAPLRHIDGFTSMLQKQSAGCLDPQGQRYLKTISDAARNMGRLIDDLLAFSRTGRSALKLVLVDQDALIGELITEGPLDQQDRPVEWEVAPLPQVHADPGLLRLVWRNLIGNAVKYSSKTPHPHIQIGAGPARTPRELVFFVRDNGVGFDMTYANKLFGVFQRLHSNVDYPGTGIGLAHVKRIITRHGGEVWAEGRPGHGATFWFSLPIHPSPPDSPATG